MLTVTREDHGTVDIWYPDGDGGNWILMKTVHRLYDIPAEQVAQQVCELHGWSSAHIAPTSEREETARWFNDA